MANHQVSGVQIAAHLQLTANTVDTITFDHDVPKIEVISHTGGSAIWYTVDGTEPAPNSQNSYVIPAGVIGSDERTIPTSGLTVVKVMSPSEALVTVYRGS